MKRGRCPLCGRDKYLSKAQMLQIIFDKIEYRPRHYEKGEGNMDRWEVLALYEYVIHGKKFKKQR